MKKILILFITIITILDSNALKSQESPYLQQHAHNPVDWMPWSKAAFAKAKREHKMIFLSIGYSTCHWCHVMEHESFENRKFAAFLNKYFVPIKVDREEMPQIDSYYQKVYQVMNGRGGGWPLTIIMTQQKQPFFAGTYIPLEPRYGAAGLWDILKQIVALKKSNPKKIEEVAKSVQRALNEIESAQFALPKVAKSNLARAFVESVAKRFDFKNGGIGRAPKFPQASTINTLLDIYSLEGNKKALQMAQLMLVHMANGGIYDQIEGGFYRYSTDAGWTIPHFEKMLYTNAELIKAYAKAYKITHKARYKEVIDETIAFLKRYYKHNGLYYGASDADSLNSKGEKEEGYYYLYNYNSVLNALKRAKVKNPEELLAYLGISWEGNFHNGLSNPTRKSHAHINQQELAKAKVVLQKIRVEKKYPFIDKKMLVAWNALLADGLYEAGYGADAKEIVDSIEKRLYRDGKLYHQILPGKGAKVAAVMEDYAYTIAALLDVYEYTQKEHYFKFVKTLYAEAKNKFYQKGTWYNSEGKFRSKADISDGAYRGALAVMGDNLLRLGILSSNLTYTEEAQKLYIKVKNEIASYLPGNASAVDFALALKSGYIIIKAPQNRLKQIKKSITKQIIYPFIVYKINPEKMLLACKSDRCFAYAKSIDTLLTKLQNETTSKHSKKQKSFKQFTPSK